MDETLWSQAQHSVSVATSASPAWLAFASSAQFGTQGANFTRTALEQDLVHFQAPWFFSLYDEQTLIGCYAIDRRQLERHGQPITGLYRGLLAVAPDYRRRGLAAQLIRHALSWATEHSAAPSLSYGCIDAGNAASLAALNTQGMQRLGTLGSVLKYSQRGGRLINASACHDGLNDAAGELQRALRAGDSLYDVNTNAADWISVSQDGSTAACKHRLVTLNLSPAAGVAGFITEHLLDYFPPGRRRFDPRKFRYVAVNEPMTTGPNAAALFTELLSHLRARYSTHFVNVALDEGDGSNSALHVRHALGRHSVAKRRHIHVLGSWHKKAPDTPTVPGAAMLLSAPDL